MIIIVVNKTLIFIIFNIIELIQTMSSLKKLVLSNQLIIEYRIEYYVRLENERKFRKLRNFNAYIRIECLGHVPKSNSHI